jgi:hypothetical protein
MCSNHAPSLTNKHHQLYYYYYYFIYFFEPCESSVAESAREGRCHIVARATLVFISLSDEGKVLPVQQIDEPAEGTRERRLFDQAKARYNARRAARQAKN